MQVDEHRALKRLAAAVLLAAVSDFKRTGVGREEKQRCARFLVSDTPWHEIVGLSPEAAAKWLRKQIEGRR